jgi:hypothetical protein
VEKHYINLQCFKELQNLIFKELNVKKKSTKIIMKKTKKSLKKTMWRNTIAIHSVLKKKKLKN